MSGNKGAYDTLSDYSHPSLLTLTLLSKERKHEDHLTFDWTMRADEISWLTRASTTYLYRSSRLVADYHRLETGRLEAWADRIEALFATA
jgi:hypothetical protein